MAFVHGAVSVGSPSQAAAEGALLQLRDLNLLPPDQDGSHSDHLPHSDQVPTPAEMKNGRSAWVGSDVLQMRWYSMACVVWYFMGPYSIGQKAYQQIAIYFSCVAFLWYSMLFPLVLGCIDTCTYTIEVIPSGWLDIGAE